MQHKRKCDECGQTFMAKTARAKFCKTACRVKWNRRPAAKAATAAAKEPQTAPASPVPRVPDRGGLISQVAADLQKAGVLDTIPGRAALALAYRVESPMETGSAAASMTRELSRLVEEARGLAPKRQDGIDELDGSVGAKLRLVG